MVSCGFLWFPVVSCGFLWFPVVSCGFLWFPVVSCGFLFLRREPQGIASVPRAPDITWPPGTAGDVMPGWYFCEWCAELPCGTLWLFILCKTLFYNMPLAPGRRRRRGEKRPLGVGASSQRLKWKSKTWLLNHKHKGRMSTVSVWQNHFN